MSGNETPIATTQPLLVTPQQAAQALAVSRETVYRMAAAGQIETVRVRGSIRVPVQAIERMCAGDEPKRAA
jgi:excisionase family DNA binding protein